MSVYSWKYRCSVLYNIPVCRRNPFCLWSTSRAEIPTAQSSHEVLIQQKKKKKSISAISIHHILRSKEEREMNNIKYLVNALNNWFMSIGMGSWDVLLLLLWRSWWYNNVQVSTFIHKHWIRLPVVVDACPSSCWWWWCINRELIEGSNHSSKKASFTTWLLNKWISIPVFFCFSDNNIVDVCVCFYVCMWSRLKKQNKARVLCALRKGNM